MHYLDWGGTGPALVLVHGFADNPHIFDDLAPAFTDRYRVVAYARRGHGRSGATPPFDAATLLGDLRGLMDHLGIERASLVSWSMGGNEITAMAAAHPERVDRLVYPRRRVRLGRSGDAEGLRGVPGRHDPSAALSFEGAVGGLGNATVGRRGSADWKVTVRGEGGHSSRIFSDAYGAGAIFELSRILHQFYEQLRGEPCLVFSPGVIVGGTEQRYDEPAARGTAFGKSNVIAATAFVHGNTRFISEEQLERSRARMREIVGRHLPRTTAEIEFDTEYYPAMTPTEGNARLLEMLDRVSRDLGHGPVTALDPAARGAGDIAFVSSIVDSLDGLGPIGEGSHSEKESLDLTTIPVQIARAAVLIHRLTTERE